MYETRLQQIGIFRGAKIHFCHRSQKVLSRKAIWDLMVLLLSFGHRHRPDWKVCKTSLPGFHRSFLLWVCKRKGKRAGAKGRRIETFLFFCVDSLLWRLGWPWQGRGKENLEKKIVSVGFGFLAGIVGSGAGRLLFLSPIRSVFLLSHCDAFHCSLAVTLWPLNIPNMPQVSKAQENMEKQCKTTVQFRKGCVNVSYFEWSFWM